MSGRLGKACRAAASLAALPLGAAWHALTGKTPELAYQGMVRLFCLSGGCSNDVAHAMVRTLRGKRPLGPGGRRCALRGRGRWRRLRSVG